MNQLATEISLLKAWKSCHKEDYCMKEVLKLRPKGNYRTKIKHVDFLDSGVDDICEFAGFVHTTAKLWNVSPFSLKDAPTISLAKKEIRK